MKRKVLMICLIVLTVLTFAQEGYFKKDVEKITQVASICIEEGVFYEDLFEVQTGITFAEAVFIPSRALGQIDFIGDYSSGVGFIYFRLNPDITEKGAVRFDFEQISLSGREKDGDAVTGSRATYYYLDENSLIKLNSYYGDLITSNDDLILFVTKDLDTNYDFIVNLITDKVQGTWKVRKKSRDYKDIEEIISNLK
ncbi:MAG TPA: hypothetical protein PK466_02415 [Thermotogota bacterium]|nr:hypothetical protein [Thermotogota bacterium]HPR95156.1 hypothetical protein [Thermotogota bacterium]